MPGILTIAVQDLVRHASSSCSRAKTGTDRGPFLRQSMSLRLPLQIKLVATWAALSLCLMHGTIPVLAQSPVLIDGGFIETVINESGRVNVTVVDAIGFGENDHGARITNTFLANTSRARLMQLNGWAGYRYDNQEIYGINLPGLFYHALHTGSGIFWTASDESPSYHAGTMHQWDDDGARPFHKAAMVTANWLAMHDILFVSSLENHTIVSGEDRRNVYCDDYPHIYQADDWIPWCGSLDDYIAYSGVASDRTIFVGAIASGNVAASGVRAGGVFDQHAIYVESPDGSTSHATPVLAAYATNLAATNPAWGAVRLKQELMALATDENLEHLDGQRRVVKVIRPAIAPTSIENQVPVTLVLQQNYPNPFNPSTTVSYVLDRPGPVSMSVYDLTGRLVSVLVDGKLRAGHHEIRFDAAGLPAGRYFYRLKANGQTITRTMTLVR